MCVNVCGCVVCVCVWFVCGVCVCGGFVCCCVWGGGCVWCVCGFGNIWVCVWLCEVCVSCYSAVLLTTGHTHRLLSWLKRFLFDRKASSHLNVCVRACMFVCVKKNVCETDRQSNSLADTNMGLLKFKVHHFCCACKMHNEINETGNTQLLLQAAICFDYVK